LEEMGRIRREEDNRSNNYACGGAMFPPTKPNIYRLESLEPVLQSTLAAEIKIADL
jgi:hypothetical protein